MDVCASGEKKGKTSKKLQKFLLIANILILTTYLLNLFLLQILYIADSV